MKGALFYYWGLFSWGVKPRRTGAHRGGFPGAGTVQGSGFRVSGLGLRAQDLGYWVRGGAVDLFLGFQGLRADVRTFFVTKACSGEPWGLDTRGCRRPVSGALMFRV